MAKATKATKAAEALTGAAADDRGESLVARIANEIGQAIASGELKPGADLNSVDLATRFGSSRTPVREALMLLEKEGLVEISPRRRPRVAAITFREIEELYEIRAHLNALVMTLFVRHAPDPALAAARQALGRLRDHAKAGDAEAFFLERAKLHDLWVDDCGNRTLKRTLDTWRKRLSLRRLGVDRPEHMQRSLLDHERLIMAIEERDEALAAALLRAMTMVGLEAIRSSGWAGESVL